MPYSATSVLAAKFSILPSREELGWPQPLPHTKEFDLSEKHSLLNVEPPIHTRLRTLVNRAFVSRQVEQLRPQVEKLAHQSHRWF